MKLVADSRGEVSYCSYVTAGTGLVAVACAGFYAGRIEAIC